MAFSAPFLDQHKPKNYWDKRIYSGHPRCLPIGEVAPNSFTYPSKSQTFPHKLVAQNGTQPEERHRASAWACVLSRERTVDKDGGTATSRRLQLLNQTLH